MNRSDFWTRAFCAIRTHVNTPNHAAAQVADEALELFDQRFRAEQPEPAINEFLVRSLYGYEGDPASTGHQRGFLAALIQIADLQGVSVNQALRDQLRHI